MIPDRPQLRSVDVFVIQQDGRPLVCLRDPLGYAEDVLAFPAAALPVLQCLDGRHALPEIQARIAAATHLILPLSELERFVRQLDEALLLDSPRFAAHQAKLLAEFRAAAERPPAYAGRSYPAEPAKLRDLLQQSFAPPKGPGTADDSPSREPPRALVAPHIDLRRGGPTFAWAYHQLRATAAPELVVVLGVAHVPTTHRYVGTKKNFVTPFGTVQTDARFMDALASQLPFDLYADELVHRHEHSIEFQLVWLQHVLGSQHSFRIAPILVGSFHDLVETETEPLLDREVRSFVKALRKTLSAVEQRVCVVASVDLAHVGSRFGDEFTVNPAVLAELEAEDRAFLDAVARGESRQMVDLIYRDHDRRRVDGFPALYTMLSALKLHNSGRLLHYDQSLEKDTNSVVTFASLRFG